MPLIFVLFIVVNLACFVSGLACGIAYESARRERR